MLGWALAAGRAGNCGRSRERGRRSRRQQLPALTTAAPGIKDLPVRSGRSLFPCIDTEL